MTINSPSCDEWVTVLEFVPGGGEPIGYSNLHALVEELRPWQPAALFSPDRYALQLTMRAERPVEAVRRSLEVHDRAVRAIGAPVAVAARIEVMTGNEFENQWDITGDGTRSAQAPNDAVLSNDLYWATRAMLRAATASELTNILVAFAVAAGGQIRPGPSEPAPGQTAFDLALEEGDSLTVVVDRVSVAGLIVEHALPMLLADARTALTRLGTTDSGVVSSEDNWRPGGIQGYR